MNEIKLQNNPFVSVDELNKVILSLFQEQNEKSNSIIFENKVERIDIVFIAGLFLLHIQKRMEFKLEMQAGWISDDRIFEVRQYLAQCQMLYRYPMKSVFPSITKIRELRNKDRIVSTSFAPILFINSRTIGLLFGKGTGNDSDNSEFSQMKSQYASFFLDADRRYENKAEKNYFILQTANNSGKGIESIVRRELENCSFVHMAVFYILYRKQNPFVKTQERGIVSPEIYTEQLWRFTEEYVLGLRELAKNIVEHSADRDEEGKGRGIITIRAYDHVLSQEHVLQFEPRQLPKVLETYVFDFGCKGIILTLKENTEKLYEQYKKERELATWLEYDLETFKCGYSLKDFIASVNVGFADANNLAEGNKMLYQQLFREQAHYGLINFYALIKRNEGEVVSSTNGLDGSRDEFHTNTEIAHKKVELGTSYYFQLPFLQRLFDTSQREYQRWSDFQKTGHAVEAVSELLNFRIDEILQDGSYRPGADKRNRKRLLDVRSNSDKIVDRKGEKELCDKFGVLLRNRVEDYDYIAIDMEEVSISASGLSRCLFCLSKIVKSRRLIVYNVNYDVYREMLVENERFFELIVRIESESPYWFKNEGVLIYSYVNKDSAKFYFADMLYGSKKEEFQRVNKIIFNTFPNAETIFNGWETVNDLVPKCLDPFFHAQKVLLPFDLLLPAGVGDVKLFQYNLEAILNIEIGCQQKMEEK